MKKILCLFTLLITCLPLSGCLPALFTAAASTTVASAKDRTFGDTVDDIAISAKIKKEFIAKGFRKLYNKIVVEVVQGRVLLTGEVETDDDIVSAVDIAWSVNGVREVNNELKVSEDSNYFDAAQFAKDSWITSRIKASIFFKRHIKWINYTVITQKNVVYIFGIARTEEELDEVSRIASEVMGVEKVVSHVHMRDQAAPKILDPSESSASEIKTNKLDDDL